MNMNTQVSQIIKRSGTLAAAVLIAVSMTVVTNAQPALYAHTSGTPHTEPAESTAETKAVSFTNAARDCDDNAVLHCGAMTTTELNQKYNASTSGQVIFTYFGISKAEVQTMGTTAVAGYVTKDGKVLVGDKQVATGALTAGRQNLAGSTKVVSQNVTFYTRTPSVSFKNDKLEAFVVLNKDKQFEYAVIAACGNPVKATNTVPAPAPVPAPVKPVETPVAPAPTPAPAPAPVVTPVEAPAPAPAPAPVQLVAAGPASVATLFAGTSVLAAAGHAVFTRIRRS